MPMVCAGPVKAEHRATALVLAGAVVWGTTGTAQALGPASSSPPMVGAMRITVGAVGLAAVAAGAGTLRDVRTWAAPGQRGATVAAALGMAAYQLSFFAGVARTGVAIGTIVALGSAPIATGVLGVAVRGERPEPRWGSATLLAVAGCALLLAPTGDKPGVDPLGVLLALGAGLSYATFVVAGKALFDAGRGVTDAMAVTFAFGALLLVPALAGGDLRWLADPRGVALVAYLGLVTVTVGYLLYASGLAHLQPSTAATLTLAEPLTAAVLGVVLLAERPGTMGTVGAGLILAGLLLLTVRRRVPAAPVPPS